MGETTRELGVRADGHALRGRNGGGAGNYFLAPSRVGLLRTEQDPARPGPAAMGSRRPAALPGSGEGGGGEARCSGQVPAERTSEPRERLGGGQDRPVPAAAGATSLSFSHSHASVRADGARGPRAGSGSPPATPWLHGGSPPEPGRPGPSPAPRGAGEGRGQLRAGPPIRGAGPWPGLCPAGAQGLSPGLPGAPVREASLPRVAPARLGPGARGRRHSPYTSARNSKTHADLHRGDSFVLQRRAITTADGGSEEMEEEEGRRRRSRGQTPPPPPPSPRLRPALSAAAGGGRGGAAARARALPLPLRRSPASPQGCARAPRRASLRGHRDGQRARGRVAREWRTRDSRFAPPGLAGAATRQTEREPAAALIRAIGNPLAGLPWFPPRAPLDFPSQGAAFPPTGARGARQCQSRGARANAGRRVALGWGSEGPPRSSAAVLGLGAARAGRVRASWEAREGRVCRARGWSEAGNFGVPLSYPRMPPLRSARRSGWVGAG